MPAKSNPEESGRDREKTQDGIETGRTAPIDERVDAALVETGRKPKTGLKPNLSEHRSRALGSRRDREKTQDGIETPRSQTASMCPRLVETGRKPKTGLKHPSVESVRSVPFAVETGRKPKTGLKLDGEPVLRNVEVVETGRKPKTGLKHGQKETYHDLAIYVETGRKPKTGLKQPAPERVNVASPGVETGRKPKTGLKPTSVGRIPSSFTRSRQGENPRRD